MQAFYRVIWYDNNYFLCAGPGSRSG